MDRIDSIDMLIHPEIFQRRNPGTLHPVQLERISQWNERIKARGVIANTMMMYFSPFDKAGFNMCLDSSNMGIGVFEREKTRIRLMRETFSNRLFMRSAYEMPGREEFEESFLESRIELARNVKVHAYGERVGACVNSWSKWIIGELNLKVFNQDIILPELSLTYNDFCNIKAARAE
jgi:hypothetical protein